MVAEIKTWRINSPAQMSFSFQPSIARWFECSAGIRSPSFAELQQQPQIQQHRGQRAGKFEGSCRGSEMERARARQLQSRICLLLQRWGKSSSTRKRSTDTPCAWLALCSPTKSQLGWIKEHHEPRVTARASPGCCRLAAGGQGNPQGPRRRS